MIPDDDGSGIKLKVENFRQMIDGLPAGIITMGSLFHPELCENPKMPFIKPVRELLKSKILFYLNILIPNRNIYRY